MIKNKKTSLLAVLVLFVSIWLFPTNMVFAGDGQDIEYNNNADYSELISFRGTNGEEKVVGADGYISYNGDEDWYRLYLESGYYSCTLTNSNMSSTNAIFGSLPADYDLYIYNYTNRNNLSNYIVRGYTGGTLTEQCHFTVNSSGYYYIRIDGYSSNYSSNVPYKMMLSKGDSAMLMEAQRYRFFPIVHYGRNGSGTEYNSVGVSYSYGLKDSLSSYTSKMEQANSYKSYPFDNWSDYKSNYPRPGKWKSEYDAGDTGQTNWAGIDCSGLVWRCAEKSEQTYSIESLGINYCGATQISAKSSSCTLANAEIAKTVYVKSTHVAMLSRLASSENRVYIIHASGEFYNRKTREDLYYSLSNYTTYSRKTLN